MVLMFIRQSWQSGRVSGRVRAEVCQNVSGRFRACIHKVFIAFEVTIFFFLEVHSFWSLRWPLWVNWLWFFLQLIPFANTTAFFCSLLGSVSHSVSEGDSCEEISTPWHCVEKINHLRDSSHVSRNETMAYYPAFPAYSAILNSSFYACSTMVDSFVIVCFYVEKHCIPQYSQAELVLV